MRRVCFPRNQPGIALAVPVPAALSLAVDERLGERGTRLGHKVAQAFSRAGHLTESAAAYEMAVRLLPAEGDLRVELAELYVRIGWRERAIEEYRQVLARQPDHGAAKRGLMAAGVQPAGTAEP